MRIAVTGASGLLGSAVLQAAKFAGHDVEALDIAPGDGVYAVDVCDRDALAAAIGEVDALVHLAAITDPLRTSNHVVHNTNVAASFNALSVAAQRGIHRVVFASSVNAIGGAFSKNPRYDYFPIDENHPSYCEDAYGLSKFIGESQADAMVRAHPSLSVASLRFHALVEDLAAVLDRSAPHVRSKDLWGWTPTGAAAEAILQACSVPIDGHERFLLVAGRTNSSGRTEDLAALHYPSVPFVREPADNSAFYDSTRAARRLGWSA